MLLRKTPKSAAAMRLLGAGAAGTLLLSALLVTGCGGGGGNGGGASTSGFPVQVKAASASGRAVLPTGFKLSPSKLRVRTGVDDQPVKADGTFSVLSGGAGQSLATLEDPTGKVVLMGFVDAGAAGSSPQAGGKGEISPKQTAVALLFITLGLSTLPADHWPDARAIVAQSPQSDQLASVISTEVAANPTALSDGDPQISAAITAARQAMLPGSRSVSRAAAARAAATSGSGPVATTVTVTRAPSGPGITIEPAGERNGLELLQSDDGAGVVVVNHARRRVAAFVYETATVDAQGNQTTLTAPKEMTFTKVSLLTAIQNAGSLTAPSHFLEVSAANVLNGTLGSLADVAPDLAKGGVFAPPNLTLQSGAWIRATSDTIALTPDANAAKTIFKVIVIGPSFAGNNNDVTTSPLATDPNLHLIPFGPEWQSVASTLVREEFILDIALPILSNIILPDKAEEFLKPLQNTTAFGPSSKTLSDDVALFQDFLGLLSNLPDGGASVRNGNVGGALKLLLQGIVDSSDIRKRIADFMLKQITFVLPNVSTANPVTASTEFQSQLEHACEVLDIVDLILAITDTSKVVYDLNHALPVTDWDVTETGGVRIDPQNSTVSVGQTLVTLTATPGTQGDPLAPFVYHWSVSGNAGGGLEDTKHRSGHDTDFDSVDAQVDYAESLNAEARQTDTVTVEVFQNAGKPASPSRGAFVGRATSIVNVATFTAVTASPKAVVLTTSSKSGTFTAITNVPKAPAIFRWTLQDSPNLLAGRLSDSHGNSSTNQLVTTDATVTYTVVTDDLLTTKFFNDDQQDILLEAFADDGSHQIPANAQAVATTTVHATCSDNITAVSVSASDFVDKTGIVTISASPMATSGSDYTVTVTSTSGNGVAVACSFADPSDIIVDGKHVVGGLLSATREDTTPFISLLGAQAVASGKGSHTFVFHMLPFLLPDFFHKDTFTDLAGHTLSQFDGPWVDAQATPFGASGEADLPFTLFADPNLNSKAASVPSRSTVR